MSDEIGDAGKEFLNLHELAHRARVNLDQNAWDYIVGGTETETTLRRNRMALDEIAFRPRVLRNVEHVDALGDAVRPQAAPAGGAGADWRAGDIRSRRWRDRNRRPPAALGVAHMLKFGG